MLQSVAEFDKLTAGGGKLNPGLQTGEERAVQARRDFEERIKRELGYATHACYSPLLQKLFCEHTAVAPSAAGAPCGRRSCSQSVYMC